MDFDDNIKQNCIYNKIKLTYILNKKLKHASTFVENSKFINNTINENEENPTLDFLKSNGNDYIIEKGNYNVNSPIVIKDKRNLIISSGVNLNFAKNTFIYIKNGDLIIDADNKDPVNLFSLKDPWNGIYVFGSKNKTILKNTKIVIIQKNGLICIKTQTK